MSLVYSSIIFEESVSVVVVCWVGENGLLNSIYTTITPINNKSLHYCHFIHNNNIIYVFFGRHVDASVVPSHELRNDNLLYSESMFSSPWTASVYW